MGNTDAQGVLQIMGPAALAIAPPRSRGVREAAESNRSAAIAPSAVPPASNTPYEQRVLEQVERRLQGRMQNPEGEPGGQLPLGTPDLQTNSPLSRFYAEAAAGELNLGERVRFVDAGELGPGVLSSRVDLRTGNGDSVSGGSAGVQDGGVILIDRRVLQDWGELDAHVVGRVLGGGGQSANAPVSDEGASWMTADRDQVLNGINMAGLGGGALNELYKSEVGPGSAAVRLMPGPTKVLGIATRAAGPLAMVADPVYAAVHAFRNSEGSTQERAEAALWAGAKRVDNVGAGYIGGTFAGLAVTMLFAPAALTVGMVSVLGAAVGSAAYNAVFDESQELYPQPITPEQARPEQ